MQTDGIAAIKDGMTELAACTQDGPGPKLEGSAAALVVAPKDELSGVLQRLAIEYNLPRNDRDGVPSKTLPTARQPYWFLVFGEKDVDRVIDCCRQAGISQVFMASWSWCFSPGHYSINTQDYPDGIESLRRSGGQTARCGHPGRHALLRVEDRQKRSLRHAGPRPPLLGRPNAAIGEDVGADNTEIRTNADLREWPGSPVAQQKEWERRRRLPPGGDDRRRDHPLSGDRPGGQVGHVPRLPTRASTARSPLRTRPIRPARHYGIDGCVPGYIIDQETDLLDETTTRLAEVFNTCGFDMVYFDGGEDVIRPRFNYYVSKFQAMAMAKFRKRPLIHMGTIMTHSLWHSFTRAARSMSIQVPATAAAISQVSGSTSTAPSATCCWLTTI